MSIARVYLNDVEIGSMPIAQYKTIVADVKTDYRLYILQAWVVLKGAVNITFSCFHGVAMSSLLLLSLLVVFFPEDLIASITELKNYSLVDIVETSRTVFIYLWIFTSLLMPLLLAFSSKPVYGIYNCFNNKINYEIRRLLEVPTEGNLNVVCYEIANEQQ